MRNLERKGAQVRMRARIWERDFLRLLPHHTGFPQHRAPHCTTLRHTATYCNTVRHTTLHYTTLQRVCEITRASCRITMRAGLPQPRVFLCTTLHHTATHCNAPQHTTTHCNILHHTTPHYTTLRLLAQLAASHWPPAPLSTTMQHTATHCNTLQHTATHCNTLQHTTTHYDTLYYTTPHCSVFVRLLAPLAASHWPPAPLWLQAHPAAPRRHEASQCVCMASPSTSAPSSALPTGTNEDQRPTLAPTLLYSHVRGSALTGRIFSESARYSIYSVE